jgi:SM-20-related protein
MGASFGVVILPSNAVDLVIDPTLEADPLRAAFARFGRIHIPAFLTPASATAVHQALQADQPWMCSTLGGGTTVDVAVRALADFTPEQTARFHALAHAEAAHGFHYMFDNLRISDAVDQGLPVDPALAAVYRLVNSPAFLDFIRTLTNDPRPVYADAQATRYMPGHYLTRHDDKKPASGRLYAYVLNLTPGWRADWGGLLNFIDEDGHVAEGYQPVFNALNLFRVPQDHAVSYVPPFAAVPRLSVTGWLRDARPAPKPRPA